MESCARQYITPEDFKRVVLELAAHKLSDSVLERLPTLCTLTPGGKISYSEVIAFHNVRPSCPWASRRPLICRSRRSCGRWTPSSASSWRPSRRPRMARSTGTTFSTRRRARRATEYFRRWRPTSFSCALSLSLCASLASDRGSAAQHFAGSGDVNARLSTADFAQLLDEKWDRPQEPAFKPAATTFFQDLGHSAYNFGLGGIAGGRAFHPTSDLESA